MAVLKNARHERFAQLIAEGKSQEAAYKEAGYKPSRSSASDLRSTPNISQRIADLLSAAAEQTELTVVKVTGHLARIATKAEALDDSPGFSVARASWMDAAKLNGLVVDRTAVDLTVQTRQALLELSDE